MADQLASVDEYLRAFRASKTLGRLIVHSHVEKEQKALFRGLSTPLPDSLSKALNSLGIPRLYTHQVQAIDLVRNRQNVVVATPTASGKSLIYNLPIVESVLKRPDSRALYIFPLKALAQDQLRGLSLLNREIRDRDITCAIYDGDTSQYKRGRIRRNSPNCLFTNPDMLHLSLLPYHDKWAEFWRNLRFVVVDEVHSYRGIMGSNMGWVFRRLVRICSRYGAHPTFILSSATIGNPLEFAYQLTGFHFHGVTESGAPQGRRHLLLVDPKGAGAAQTAVQLILAAMKRGLRTICYTQSRKLTELVSLWVRQRAGSLADKVSAYRAGFLPEERRLVESQLSRGELLAVISTSALELGIDIGLLDLCILVGYPGTLMSLRQRGGRVGRSSRESAVILVGGEDALDRYFLNNPRELVERPTEKAVINVWNPRVVEKHLVCAASEAPIDLDESMVKSEAIRSSVISLVNKGRLFMTGDGSALVSLRKYPQREVDLRGTGKSYQIVNQDNGKSIGSVDGYRVFRELHPGAIYLHRGESFQVTRLDIEARRAEVRPVKVDYFTRVRSSKETEIVQVVKSKTLFGAKCYWGRLLITDRVVGYDVRQIRGQRLITRVDLDLPAQRFETEGLWIQIPGEVKAQCEQALLHFMGGIHAIEHAIIGVMPLFVLCDRNDLGGISITFHPQLMSGAVFVYDSVPGGVGLTEEAYGRLPELFRLTRQTIEGCKCENGCPSCVHSPKCGSGNRPIDKGAAIFLLRQIERPRRLVVRRMAPEIGQPVRPSSASVGNWGQIGMAGIKGKAKLTETEILGACAGVKGLDTKVRYGVLDIETQLSAQEVGGWHKAKDMRVSCAVVWDSATSAFAVFREEQLKYLFELLTRLDLVVGFNLKRFDYKVLSRYCQRDLSRLPTLDILEHVTNRLGYRLSLDTLAKATLGTKKSASGLMALKWWKEGKTRKIIEYCKKDVTITRDLFAYGRQNGYLLFKNKEGCVVRLPVEW